MTGTSNDYHFRPRGFIGPAASLARPGAGLARPWAGLARAVAGLVSIVLIASTLASVEAYGQRRTTQRPALARKPLSIFDTGYARGYGAGFGSGEQDWDRSAPRDFVSSDVYINRQQSFDPSHADSEEYRQGFELGFELGYNDGYFGRTRNAAVPSNAAVLAKAAALADARRERERQAPEIETRPRTTSGPAPLVVPSAAEFKLRLQSQIDTKESRVGDKFTATVVSPSSFETAMVEGHISKLNRSGRMTGKTELTLQFDSISIDGQTAPFRAELIRIYDSEKVKQIDEEGNVETSSRTSDTTKRSTIGAVAGAVLGGIAGGGKGAAIGAVIGAGAGAGTVLIEGNKDLRLEPGTEILVRTEGQHQAPERN
jgi:hypothetical protein